MTRVLMLWHGGPSYSVGSVPDDVESFDSIRAAVAACDDRYHNRDGSTPCVEYDNESHRTAAWLWFGYESAAELAETHDPYPDRVISRGPRGGWRVTSA